MQDTGKTLLQPKGSRNIVEIVFYACLYFQYEVCGESAGKGPYYAVNGLLCGERLRRLFSGHDL